MTNNLSNGIIIPNLCFGTGIISTYRYSDYSKNKELKYKFSTFFKDRKQWKNDYYFSKMVDIAMKNGCNMFDTSRAYAGAEYELGKALKKYKRDEYFITTKLCNRDQIKGDIRGAIEKSLKELNLEYVDLYLMHWPVTETYVNTWKEMENLYKEGKCRAIGVSNFNVHHLKELKKTARIFPMVNEIECHPLFTQNELRKYCDENGVKIMAYTSTAKCDERLKKTKLPIIAKKYNKSITQVILRWHQQIGNIPIFNSTNLQHMKDNCDIKDFLLTNEELKIINDININSRLRYDPDNCDFKQL